MVTVSFLVTTIGSLVTRLLGFISFHFSWYILAHNSESKPFLLLTANLFQVSLHTYHPREFVYHPFDDHLTR